MNSTSATTSTFSLRSMALTLRHVPAREEGKETLAPEAEQLCAA